MQLRLIALGKAVDLRRVERMVARQMFEERHSLDPRLGRIDRAQQMCSSSAFRLRSHRLGGRPCRAMRSELGLPASLSMPAFGTGSL